MFNDMDSQALFSSEVFRNLVDIELKKEAEEKAKAEDINKNALNNFLDFQKKVNASLELKNKFRELQKRFASDPEYCKSVNEDFVRGVLLLELED